MNSPLVKNHLRRDWKVKVAEGRSLPPSLAPAAGACARHCHDHSPRKPPAAVTIAIAQQTWPKRPIQGLIYWQNQLLQELAEVGSAGAIPTVCTRINRSVLAVFR